MNFPFIGSDIENHQRISPRRIVGRSQGGKYIVNSIDRMAIGLPQLQQLLKLRARQRILAAN